MKIKWCFTSEYHFSSNPKRRLRYSTIRQKKEIIPDCFAVTLRREAKLLSAWIIGRGGLGLGHWRDE